MPETETERKGKTEKERKKEKEKERVRETCIHKHRRVRESFQVDPQSKLDSVPFC